MPGQKSAHELLNSLSLEEKITFLHQHVPAVPRLGLASFTTGTEGLHGLSWLGEATVFPQPPGLAASWSPELLTRVGNAVATEVRAKHAQNPKVSLNVWAPVVNTLRHPLWGRGEEGYSEDADVTARLATAFCLGLRGDHPRVWKTVPTLKHFLAYGNEVDRAVTSSHLPPQTLRETELPAFIGPLRAGVVGAVMPSYNLVNGRPNHVARELLTEMRSWSPSSITVVSDAQAPSNLVDGERYFPDHIQSTAAALKAGVDSFTDNDARSEITIERVTRALAAGLLSESDIDAAVLRLLELREKTGEFTGEDPYQICPDSIDTPEHRALARDAAGSGVVILKNELREDGHPILPLTSPKVVAVVGPFANHVVSDWYSGTLPYSVGITDAISERYPSAEVRFADGSDIVSLRVGDEVLATSPDGEAVTASEIDSTALSTQFALTNWGHDIVSLRSLATNKLLTGAGWIVTANAERIGGWVAQELFRVVRSGEGALLQHAGSGRWLRVQLGSRLLVSESDPQLATVFSIDLIRSGVAAVQDACTGADVALVALGNDPHIHGRETADRPDLDLPAAMHSLWRTALAACPATVLTIVSSYPYAIPAEVARSAAVVWTCHAGQELGHGLVDVLSGDRVPTGRLPQTWWAAADDAGDLLDYDVVNAGATYRYNTAKPLFGLGHGLNYSPIVYESLTLSVAEMAAPGPSLEHEPAFYQEQGEDTGAGAEDASDGTIPATVTLRNAGQRDVNELVTVWAQAPQLPIRAPRTRLLGWTRVHLEAGARKRVTLPIRVQQLAVWDVLAVGPRDNPLVSTPGAYRVQPGTYRIASGPSAADLKVGAELTVSGPSRPPRMLAGSRIQADSFSAYKDLVTSDYSRTSGTCVEVAAGKYEGWARFDAVNLDGVAEVSLKVGTRRFPSSAPTLISLQARTSSGPGPKVWQSLSEPVSVPAAVPADDVNRSYEWLDVTVSLDSESTVKLEGTVDLRLVLSGAARVAFLDFSV